MSFSFGISQSRSPSSSISETMPFVPGRSRTLFARSLCAVNSSTTQIVPDTLAGVVYGGDEVVASRGVVRGVESLPAYAVAAGGVCGGNEVVEQRDVVRGLESGALRVVTGRGTVGWGGVGGVPTYAVAAGGGGNEVVEQRFVERGVEFGALPTYALAAGGVDGGNEVVEQRGVVRGVQCGALPTYGGAGVRGVRGVRECGAAEKNFEELERTLKKSSYQSDSFVFTLWK